MADINDTLSQIASSAKSGAVEVVQLQKAISKLAVEQKKMQQSGNLKAVVAYDKMRKSIENLIATTEKYNKEIEELKSKQEDLTEEEIKRLAKLEKAHQKSSQVILNWQQKLVDAEEEKRRQVEKTEALLLEHFRTHTLLGKAFGEVRSALTGMAQQFSFTGLAMKALNRYMQASEIQQNILIQNYKGLAGGNKKTQDSIDHAGDSFAKMANQIPEVGKAVGKFGKEIIQTGARMENFIGNSLTLTDALAQTEATAQRLGVSTELVGETFTRFSRIAGTDSPKVLKTLSEGAISVSRSLGISVPEAIDFVATRMDKFGGSASSAILTLKDMREESTRVNNAFGRTVIRGDDVARTVQEISKQTNIYAVDQRFVGNVLRENIARLQATGLSYEAASKQAATFSEALTGKAPKWMKVYASYDIGKKLMGSFKGGKFAEEFGAELEAAKPGLSKEIQDLLADVKKQGRELTYSEGMYVQEAVSGSVVGMEAMNKEILKLAKHEEGLALIAQAFTGDDMVAAKGLQTQALMFEERQTALGKLAKAGIIDLQQKVTLNKKDFSLTTQQVNEVKKAEQAAREGVIIAAKKNGEILKAGELQKQQDIAAFQAKKEALNSIFDQENERVSIEMDMQRLQREELINTKELEKIHAKIGDAQKRKAELQFKFTKAEGAEKADIEKQMARLDKIIKEEELKKSKFESKAAEEKGLTEGLKGVEEGTKSIEKQMKGYSDATAKSLQAMLTQLTSTNGLLIAAGVMGIGKLIMWYTGPLKRIEKLLIDIASKKVIGGDDGDGGGFYSGGDGKKKKGKGKKREKGKSKKVTKTTKGRNPKAKIPMKSGGRLSTLFNVVKKSALTTGPLAMEYLSGLGDARHSKLTSAKGMAPELPKNLAKDLAASGKGLAKEVGEGVAKEAGKGLVKEAGKGLAKEVGKGLVKEAGKDLLKEAGKGLAKEAGEGLIKSAGKGIAKKLPLGVGGLVNAAFAAKDIYDVVQGGGNEKDILKTSAGVGAGALGSIAGTATGAAIGTMLLPGPGTALGGLLGGMAGEFIGNKIGEIAGTAIADLLPDEKQQKKDKEKEREKDKTVAIAGIKQQVSKVSPLAGAGLPANFGVLAPRLNPAAMATAKGPTSLAPMPTVTKAGTGGDVAGGGGGMTGTFGTLGADGSITLTVNNFLEVFAKAQSMAKQGIRSS